MYNVHIVGSFMHGTMQSCHLGPSEVGFIPSYGLCRHALIADLDRVTPSKFGL